MSEPPLQTISPATFLITKEVQRFTEFCDACRRYRYIGLCYGPAGVGKSLSARQYARWDSVEPQVVSSAFRDKPPPPPELASCRSILYTPAVSTSPKRVGEDIDQLSRSLSWAVELLVHPDEPDIGARVHETWTELVLVDEADRLKLAALEELRDRYDRHRFGLVLIGMPGIEKRLARYPQLYSRVGFVHQFRPLAAEEVRFLLTRKWEQLGLRLSPDDFTDAEALAAVVRITGGNFRLLHRLLTQVERILAINELRTVTKEVVETAREGLVIGPL